MAGAKVNGEIVSCDSVTLSLCAFKIRRINNFKAVRTSRRNSREKGLPAGGLA